MTFYLHYEIFLQEFQFGRKNMCQIPCHQ
ncbi:hypothetical protein OESDEN_23543 [Oesophagostomum dentatum]|uniref:Uncharacterized protein n=1 Tax=Oesophagostomum dentatum TaxID=61180 RepID=A0A0B1S009_OESDE|nr:hypothetical protein OESDEN_23543 [Oesophagostomum dentatum]